MIPNIKKVEDLTEDSNKELRSFKYLSDKVNYEITKAAEFGKRRTEVLVYLSKPSHVLKIKKELVKAGYKVELPSLSVSKGPPIKYYFNMYVSWSNRGKATND